MIRVLHSVSNMDRGGIETMLMNLYRNIDRDKIQFDFLCNKSKPGAFDKEIAELGGRIYISPGLNPVKFLKYQKYMDDLFESYNYKIVHAHNGAFGYYPLVGAKRNNIPVRIFHAHGASITVDLKLPLKLLCKSGLPNVCNQHFTCGVSAAECYFGKKAVESGDYVMINNAIDVERFVFSSGIRDRLRAENNINDRFAIGHVGRFMKQKNHSFAVDMFYELYKHKPNAMLVFLGDGELMDEIKQKVNAYNLQDRVVFKGNIANVNEWYQALDAFILPSQWEGLPVVGIEAQAAGLPCFFSDTITTEAKVTDNVKFLSISDTNVWVKSILETCQTHIRADMTESVINAGYEIKEQAKRLEDLYLKLAGE